MSAPARRLADVRFRGFERRDRSTLRATFDVRIGDEHFAAVAVVDASGRLHDLQARGLAGTTGDEVLDVLIARTVEEKLIDARSAAVVAEFDGRRGRRL